jgi:glycosyltransferase involved in cell wall biosynthesis
VLEWLSDRGESERLRSQCRAYVEARYGWNSAVDELEEVIYQTLNGG